MCPLPFSRRPGGRLGGLAIILALIALPARSQEMPEAARPLPLEKTFRGESKFDAVVKKALAEDWRALPIGERVARFAREFHHVPYEGFTLEIDDHIESPSVNLEALDCWTFFETCLGLARMIAIEKPGYEPGDLLDQIEFTRYRGGECRGGYLERIHYLAEWYFENDARGTIDDLTRTLPGAERIEGRKIREMTDLWESYRYLRENPELRAPMKEWEAYVAAMPVYRVPKDRVAEIEDRLQDGDIIGIATHREGGFCSHVGVALRTDDGVMRLMHASSTHKKVVIDESISDYLESVQKHAGILVGRPLEVSETVEDPATYRKNLERLLKRK